MTAKLITDELSGIEILMTRLTLLDGGMGRELQRIGAPFSQPLWSAQALIEAPHFVHQAHRGFIDAGAQIITVNSYACVPFHMGEEGYQEQGQALAKQAAEIAREVADTSPTAVQVAGSLPPAFGSYRPDLFKKDQAYCIADTLFSAQEPYVDLWLAETVASIEEAEVYADVLRQSAKPFYISFTLADEDTEYACLRSGELVSDAVTRMLDTNAAGVFFNCSVPEVIAQALEDTNAVLAEHSRQLTLGVYANSFAPIKSSHEANDTLQEMRHYSAEDYLALAQSWHALGAEVIGGCCGIGPAHIAALATWQATLEQS